MALWPAVKKEIKGRQVVDKMSPKLGINRGGWFEEFQCNACFCKQSGMEVSSCGILCQEMRGGHFPTNVDQKRISFTVCIQIGLQCYRGVYP